jgi:hypothetical protein
MTATEKFTKGLKTFASDVAQGFFEITHNGFALVGLAVMFAVPSPSTARPEILRLDASRTAVGQLASSHARQIAA